MLVLAQGGVSTSIRKQPEKMLRFLVFFFPNYVAFFIL